MAVSLYHQVALTTQEVGMSATLNVPNLSGRAQILIGIQLSSPPFAEPQLPYPITPTAYIGDTQMTLVRTNTANVGGELYIRISCFKAFAVNGSHAITVSKSGAWRAYSYSGVNTSLPGGGVSATSRTPATADDFNYVQFTANNSGSATVVCMRSFSSVTAGTYSGTTVDLTSSSNHFGHDSNSTTSVLSGFSWAGQGDYLSMIQGVLLQAPDPGTDIEVTGSGQSPAVDQGMASTSVYSLLFCDPLLGTGNNDGSSWENAYWSFADAVNASVADQGDMILVKAGLIQDITEEVIPKQDTSIYGGFSRSLTGTNAPVDERQPFSDRTIIRMVYPSTQFGCIGEGVSGVDDVLIDGFHFVDCINDSVSAGNRRGGAIRANSGANWTIQSCKFDNCSVGGTGRGGAICGVTATNLKIINCHFKNCIGGESSFGGGVCLYESNGYIVKCTFDECDAMFGAAIDIKQSYDDQQGILISDCSVLACDAQYGAIYITGPYTYVNIFRCIISGCGGDSAIRYANDNESAQLSVVACLIVGNEGDGFRNNGSAYFDLAVLTNCTISGNGGYGINFTAGSTRSVSAHNCVIWGNTTGQVSTTLTACTYSDVQGGHTGTGNINSDPLFRGAGDSKPYYLGINSPCINAGNASVDSYNPSDLTGYTRVDTPDMGCYEFLAAVYPPGAIDTSLYRLQLNGVSTFSIAPFNFVFPYRMFEPPADVIGVNFGSSIFNSIKKFECNPLQFGSEFMNDSDSAALIEFFKSDNSKINIPRVRRAGSSSPRWTNDDFEDAYKTDTDWIGGNGAQCNGMPFIGTFKEEAHQPLFDLIRYSVMYVGHLLDPMMVYNIWLEGWPESERDSEPCARWLASYVDVSEPDLPVSSGTMKEFCRVLNRILWEKRGPMSVPVFGKYIIWVPPGPVV